MIRFEKRGATAIKGRDQLQTVFDFIHSEGSVGGPHVAIRNVCPSGAFAIQFSS